VIGAEMHLADRGDTATLPGTLESAARHLAAVEAAPSAEDPAELVADTGYHSREVLKALDDGPWKTRIAEPERDGFLRWHGDDAARRAVVNNRIRLLSGCCPGSPGLRSSRAPRWSSGASRRSSTAVACAGPGCAAGRTCTSAT
jgi:hypothetical protein